MSEKIYEKDTRVETYLKKTENLKNPLGLKKISVKSTRIENISEKFTKIESISRNP